MREPCLATRIYESSRCRKEAAMIQPKTPYQVDDVGDIYCFNPDICGQNVLISSPAATLRPCRSRLSANPNGLAPALGRTHVEKRNTGGDTVACPPRLKIAGSRNNMTSCLPSITSRPQHQFESAEDRDSDRTHRWKLTIRAVQR
jgi:hypothetical protein